jgi:hypothetical protein
MQVFIKSSKITLFSLILLLAVLYKLYRCKICGGQILETEFRVRSEVLMAVKMSLLFLWVMMSCSLVGRYHFGETNCLHIGTYLLVHTASQPGTSSKSPSIYKPSHVFREN